MIKIYEITTKKLNDENINNVTWLKEMIFFFACIITFNVVFLSFLSNNYHSVINVKFWKRTILNCDSYQKSYNTLMPHLENDSITIISYLKYSFKLNQDKTKSMGGFSP